jgi:stage V sporulation protein B
MAIYGDAAVGRSIRILAPLMPIMYLDSVTDGMLRGLGQQMYSMKYNILDSAISVALVYALLPRYAIAGYLFMICFTEVFNFALSIGRLRRVTRLNLPLKTIALSVFCGVCAVTVTAAALRALGIDTSAAAVSVAVFIALSAAAYCGLLLIFGCFGAGDVRRLREVISAFHGTSVKKTEKRIAK